LCLLATISSKIVLIVLSIFLRLKKSFLLPIAFFISVHPSFVISSLSRNKTKDIC
jgi:hypothetical protein